MALEVGQVLEGKYRIVRLLGEGGMGAVYEGLNERIQRRVAIKVLHAAVATDSSVVERFQREASAAGKIGSDHIVEVIDLGTLADGDYFMVMEFLAGESLGQRLQRISRMPARELAPLGIQLLEGLAAAHGAGIIHRDLKPDNVWLVSSKAGIADFVKILDFGISKFNALDGEAQMSMTRTGSVMGTPYYLSPEQAKGGRGLDQRSDIYAVGVILYEALTGGVPFKAETFNELLFKIALEQVVDPREHVPDLDPGFAAIVLKAMARDRNDRYSSAAEFAGALADWAGLPFDGKITTPVHGAVAPHASRKSDAPIADTNTPPPFSHTEPPVATPRRRTPVLVATGALMVLVVAGGIGMKLATTESAVAASQPVTQADAPLAPEPAPAAPHPIASASAATSAAPIPSASAAPPATVVKKVEKALPGSDTNSTQPKPRMFRDKL